MSASVYRITHLLSSLLSTVPVGTNLGLFHVLATLVSGRLLASRGALIPALADTGLPPDAVRRAWAAFAQGRWTLPPLLDAFQHQVRQEGAWRPCEHAGLRPVACDTVGFFRPRLQHCPTSHFSHLAGHTVPAIPFGVAARIGEVGGKRVPLPCQIVRADPADPREEALIDRVLAATARQLAEDEILLTDRGFRLAQVQAAEPTRFLARMPRTFTARRSVPRPYSGRGRPPELGELVRPLPRKWKDRTLPATPPDRIETWQEGEHPLVAHCWDDLVRADEKPGAATFHCRVIFDPRYRDPWVLITPLALSGADCRALYPHRWPVEQLPLAAKQLLGAARQFVFAAESRPRLPELALLAGAVLMYAAATLPAVPTGFWDRNPKPTAGRLRRVLARAEFPKVMVLAGNFHKKASPTEHLPKGVAGHRRQKGPPPTAGEARRAA